MASLQSAKDISFLIDSVCAATVTVYPIVIPVLSISKFRLIDADKDVVILAYDPLADGAKINKAIYPGLLNIEAITNPATVGSVKFELLSRTGLTTITRNTYPYTRWSYSKGNYSGSNLLGEYQLTATPYSGVNGTGEAGVPLTIRFAVEYENPRIEKFKLIDATLDQPASGYDPLVDGAILSLTSIPSYVNIEAITNPTRLGSVKLVLTKPSGIVMTVKRDLPLYTVWSRTGTDYKGVKLGKGKYVLSVTPYSQSSYQGVVGETKTIRFEVV